MFQKIAWETLCAYNRDGVDCNSASSIKTDKKATVSIVPNPAETTFVLKGENIVKVEIFTMEGKQVYANSRYMNEKIELKNAGMYLIKIFDQNNNVLITEKVTKQ